MKLAIVGSRDFPDTEMIQEFVALLPKDTLVISGGARGTDSIAVQAARTLGMEIQVFMADWNRFGKVAGFKRNHLIIEACDAVVGFWFRRSRGTQHSLELAQRKYEKPGFVYEWELGTWLPIHEEGREFKVDKRGSARANRSEEMGQIVALLTNQPPSSQGLPEGQEVSPPQGAEVSEGNNQ